MKAGLRLVRYLDRAKTPLFPDPIAVSGQRDGIGIDVALEWNDSYYSLMLPFTSISLNGMAVRTWQHFGQL